MAESQGAETSGGGEGEMVPELEPKEFDQLTEMVYRLLRDEMLLEMERRGAFTTRERR